MLTQIGETYILLLNRIGQSIAPIPDFASLEYAKTVNQVGVMTVLLPIKYQSNIQFLNQMVIIRRAYGGMRYQEFGALWFVVKYQIYTDDQGVRWVKVTCFCGNAILQKRVVAYYAASTNASMTGFAGNLMKQVCRDNIGSTANDYSTTANVASGSLPARGLSTTYFGIDADTGDGASISIAFSWRRVLDTLSDMAELSYNAGSYIAFDMINDAPGHLQLTTFPGKRGSDRRWQASGLLPPVILDPLAGNLTGASLTYDWSDFASYVYAAGQGQETARLVGTDYDLENILNSPFGRWEKVVDAKNVKTQTLVDQQAALGLQDSVPQVVFDGGISDAPGSIYGINYFWGDLVTARIEDNFIDCYLDYVHVTVSAGSAGDNQGVEKKEITLRKY
jgi:hypothetical protein